MLDAPPIDLAPRVASASITDFVVPHGREEEWRFTPMDAVRPFLDLDPAAGTLTAEESQYVSVVGADSADDAAGWLPTDRAAAVAWAGCTGKVVVEVPAGRVVAEPIVVALRADTASAYGRVEVRVGSGACATVVIVHAQGIDTSGAIVTDVGDDARVTMLSVVDGPAVGTHLWHAPIRVGRTAEVLSAQVTTGGRVVRILPSVRYAGPGGSVELLGAFLSAPGQYLEHRILVDHGEPHCASRVVYKGVLTGAGARSVWIGDVLVRRDAIGVDTYELNRNLLLASGARADSVPNLELETGNVVSAGHASATGTFDDEQLFYLQARGIPADLARQLVVQGFFLDVLSRLPEGDWRDRVVHGLAERLGMTIEAGG